MMIRCLVCSCPIHISCLRIKEKPLTPILGDNFFDLRCAECHPQAHGYDYVKRGRIKV